MLASISMESRALLNAEYAAAIRERTSAIDSSRVRFSSARSTSGRSKNRRDNISDFIKAITPLIIFAEAAARQVLLLPIISTRIHTHGGVNARTAPTAAAVRHKAQTAGIKVRMPRIFRKAKNNTAAGRRIFCGFLQTKAACFLKIRLPAKQK